MQNASLVYLSLKTFLKFYNDYTVPPGKSVLDVLLDHGVDVPYSCMQGICGSCRVGVKAGEPEHRDDCLSEAERAANTAMAVCCSGSRSAKLVLDL